jgi:hypothetical protein
MTVGEFIAEIEGYYGQYQPMQKKYVRQWLSRREEFFAVIFSEILRNHSAVLRMPPGIKEFEEALAGIETIQPWKQRCAEIPQAEAEQKAVQEKFLAKMKERGGVAAAVMQEIRERRRETGERLKEETPANKSGFHKIGEIFDTGEEE